jgi:hypothetical protein
MPERNVHSGKECGWLPSFAPFAPYCMLPHVQVSRSAPDSSQMLEGLSALFKKDNCVFCLKKRQLCVLFKKKTIVCFVQKRQLCLLFLARKLEGPKALSIAKEKGYGVTLSRLLCHSDGCCPYRLSKNVGKSDCCTREDTSLK